MAEDDSNLPEPVDEQEVTFDDELPVLPIRNAVLFPGAVAPFDVGREKSVALVEDTMTTGGSTLEALDIVEAAGGKVARVLCIVDRGEGAADAFAARGLTVEPLYTRTDLPV